LINYLIWFFFAVHVFQLDPAHFGTHRLFAASCLLLPVSLAIPTVIEVRFFLPLYIFAYGVISYGFDLSRFQERLAGDPWYPLRSFVLCTLWIVVSFTLSADTSDKLVM
ncbi:MAG: hypothetical protein L0287_35935, partial [Anaerolineae bacterium]|nr:hypothetical protein [Anaerolineae bacterium]